MKIYYPYLMLNTINFDPKKLIPIFSTAKFQKSFNKKHDYKNNENLSYYKEYIKSYTPTDKKKIY